MIATLYILTLISAYLLIRLIINWYFKTKKGRYSLGSNYLFKYSIGILFSAFCLINPKITPHVINWIIKNINKNYGTELLILNTNIELYIVVIYLILCVAVVYLLNIAFKARNQKALQYFITRKEDLDTEKKELSFPDDSFQESPIFHERIKKYFELKYKKQDLILNVSTKDNLIYGKYNEGFRHYFIVIKYSENEESNNISKETQKLVFEEIQNVLKKLKLKDDKTEYLYDHYFIINQGTFEPAQIKNFFTKTENDILNELIDFKIYLKSLISKYNSDKIFSAIAKESDKKTLSNTFIMPSYSLDNGEVPNSNLEEYVTKWLSESPVPKHLVLLGDYGMGKTSFLKYYAKQLADAILSNQPVLRFPVFISLNNTSPRHGGIKKTISAFVAENLGVDYELFEILVHKGKILFLLDAFDEMGFVGTHGDRFKQINEIWKLAFKNNKILLSGRSSYFPSDYELRQTLNIIPKDEEVIQTQPYCSSVRLKFLGENQIKEYISKYYKPERTEQLFAWIESAPSILELCRRPSLMHIIREMLPKLHRNDSKEIHNPGGAIEKYVDYWINRQESKDIQSAFSDNNKKRDFIKSFFRHVAVHTLMSKQYRISTAFIKEELNSFIEKYNIKNLSKKYQKEGFENEILTGYFIELENDYFRFVHKSFFEYFVAKEIISLIKARKFKSKILFEDWSNPIVNFIYDAIPSDLRLNTRIPALMLLMQNGILSKVKNTTTRFFLKQSDIITVLILFFALSTSVVFYFILIPWSTMVLILLFIPFLIIMILLLALIHDAIQEIINSNKNVKFVIKAFKVAFIKKQFEISENLEIVIPLLKKTTAPHIPLEDIEFKSESFKNCKFYRLKNIVFKDCKFQIPVLSSCHLHNVDFKNSRMNNIIFNKCRFTNVIFNELKLILSENHPQLTNKLNLSKDSSPLMYFRNCKLDNTTVDNLRTYIDSNGLILGESIDGCKDFKKIMDYSNINNRLQH